MNTASKVAGSANNAMTNKNDTKIRETDLCGFKFAYCRRLT